MRLAGAIAMVRQQQPGVTATKVMRVDRLVDAPGLRPSPAGPDAPQADGHGIIVAQDTVGIRHL